MKSKIKIFALILTGTFLFTVFVYAQAPEKFMYQAVVRDATNLLLPLQTVGVQISILRGATPIYVETHNATTNTNALLSVEVGTGTIVSGVFADIDWSLGIIYVKADIDPAGGTSYTITGNAEILSMPYAFFAKTAENGFSGDFNDLINKPVFNGSETKLVAGSKVTITGTGESGTPYMVNALVPVSGFAHYIGEELEGGIVFYIYRGKDGLEYDMIVYPTEQTSLQWENVSVLRGANLTYDGEYNMNRMLQVSSPAKQYIFGLGAGWYLPSVDELSMLYQNRFLVNEGLEKVTGATNISIDTDYTGAYWSSTEYSSGLAYCFVFGTGEIYRGHSKSSSKRVRAIKTVPALIGTPFQGGVIAYIFRPGDPGYVAGEVHGLIAANADIGTAPWGCFGTEITGADAGALGTGSQNTLDILAGCAAPGTAARICADYVNIETGTGVYSDWFLPTTGELLKLEMNQTLIGGFASTAYWSSREGAMGVNAYYVHFVTGSSSQIPKTSNQPVRPIRYF